jgi:hypothetical protein
MATKQKINPKIENRITNEIIVDASTPEEQIIGWYNYLEQQLIFPFTARCISNREISPIGKGEIVEVIGMASEKECQYEMFIKIHFNKRKLAIPLSQISPISSEIGTKRAINDWHYWVNQGNLL